MELFIPSIVVLVLGALISFFLLPRMSPYVLGMLCLAMFALGVWQHYSMFPYEYRASMVTDIIKQYSGFIMLLAVIFAGIFAVVLFRQPGTNSAASANAILPTLKIPNVFSGNSKNNSKSMFNLSGNSGSGENAGVAGVIDNVSKSMTNFLKSNNQSKSNNLVSPSFKVS